MSSAIHLTQGIMDDIYIHKINPSEDLLRRPDLNEKGGEGNEDNNDLTVSIKEKGLLQPILVRPKRSGFEIVAGNRRMLACKKLGWKKITCHIIDVDDKTAFEISLSENLQRKNLSPIEEAEAFKAYIADFGYGGVSELASRIGKSPSYITRRVKLLDLHPDIIDSITNTAINTSIAQELSYVQNKSVQPKLATLVTKQGLSYRETRELLKNYQSDPVYAIQLEDKEKTGLIQDSVEKRKSALNKSIIVLRIAADRLVTIIEDMEKDWFFKEILMHHKNAVNQQIDILIREKRKLKHRLPS
ncbi:MAG TPA: ParB/RepB/Spo0J family partition protein [Nitrososphaeraceae archaeon]|nr:ParB/RepB/Spo0J family partition protein [Nitrososphaeraceae archaeon]